MKRGAFTCSLLAGWLLPRVARATGGLDVGSEPEGAHMRVLLASGERVGEPEMLDGWHFRWNGRTYRGSYAFVTLENGRRGLVNTVPLDAYLYGVLGAEISYAWPAGVLGAQAIVSRTYALGKLRPNRAYDINAGVNDQGYSGIDGESVEARDAVDSTAGTIVAFEGAPAHVAFSACCGGRTADAGDVWRTSYPYLRSKPDPYCAGTPNYEWTAEVPIDALGQLDLDRAGALHGVSLLGPDGSGRPRALAFAGAKTTLDVDTSAFRAVAGSKGVRSTFLRSVALEGGASSLAVAGHGFGHGVGLCQWGARAMAGNDAPPDEISAFYVPGTTLAQL